MSWNGLVKHDLTQKHLIGSSNLQYSKVSPQLSTMKYVSMKVIEAHYTGPNTITYCSNFQSIINDVPTKLGVQVQIQQDVSPQAMNPCHSSSEPSDECVFTAVNASSSLVQFATVGTGKDPNSLEISSKGAVPNLVSPYRRKFLARIERNDGWAVTNLAVEREFVTVASKYVVEDLIQALGFSLTRNFMRRRLLDWCTPSFTTLLVVIHSLVSCKELISI